MLPKVSVNEYKGKITLVDSDVQTDVTEYMYIVLQINAKCLSFNLKIRSQSLF